MPPLRRGPRRPPRALGLRVEPFVDIDRFDIAIDGADQIAPDGWLVKGAGAAHTREKIVAAAADRFVVIADSSKPVAALHAPIPLELMAFGLLATLRHLGSVTLRDVPHSPDGGIIADFTGPVDDPRPWRRAWRPRPASSGTGSSHPRWSRPCSSGRGDAVERTDVTHH